MWLWDRGSEGGVQRGEYYDGEGFRDQGSGARCGDDRNYGLWFGDQDSGERVSS